MKFCKKKVHKFFFKFIVSSTIILSFLWFQVQEGLEKLIQQHQVVPGSIMRALLERISFSKNKSS